MAIAFEKVPFERGQSFRLLRWSENVRDVQMCLPGGKIQPLVGAGERWHFHPEVELTLVTHGRGRRFVGDHLAAFDAPDLVLIGSNLPHCWSELHDAAGFAVQFSVDSQQPLWQLHELSSMDRLLERAQRGLRLSGPIVDHVARSMRAMPEAGPIERLARFMDILSALASMPREAYEELSTTQFGLGEQDHHLGAISQAVQTILEHLHEPILLDDLLAITHMSKSTFCRQFKRHTGRSFATFVKEVRVNHAQRLLADTDHPITQIAMDCGYHNLSHFNRQFREQCRITPRDYRRSVRSDRT